MSVCPWCKAQNVGSADKCPRCGKRAAEHPSIAGRDMGTLGDFSSGKSEPPPALQIELAGSSPTRRGVSDDTGAGTGGMKNFGDDWGDDEPAKDGASLDLADVAAPTSTRGKTARTAATNASGST